MKIKLTVILASIFTILFLFYLVFLPKSNKNSNINSENFTPTFKNDAFVEYLEAEEGVTIFFKSSEVEFDRETMSINDINFVDGSSGEIITPTYVEELNDSVIYIELTNTKVNYDCLAVYKGGEFITNYSRNSLLRLPKPSDADMCTDFDFENALKE